MQYLGWRSLDVGISRDHMYMHSVDDEGNGTVLPYSRVTIP